MKSVGIALSGGGARGIAHLGILKVLEEHGIKPQVISGASAGGMVGAFYAAGYSPDEILGFMKHMCLIDLFKVNLHGNFLSMNVFKELYSKHIPHNSFDKLNMPLYIAATDIRKGEIKYFSSGPIDVALLATSCVPLAFEPVICDDTELLDGGILNNMPTEPLAGKCDTIIAVYVNSIDTTITEVHKRDLIDRVFHMAIRADMEAKGKQCDLFLQPPVMSRFGIFDVGRADEIFKAGYEYAKGMSAEIELFADSLNL